MIKNYNELNGAWHEIRYNENDKSGLLITYMMFEI
jgi:hypothetical protein